MGNNLNVNIMYFLHIFWRFNEYICLCHNPIFLYFKLLWIIVRFQLILNKFSDHLHLKPDKINTKMTDPNSSTKKKDQNKSSTSSSSTSNSTNNGGTRPRNLTTTSSSLSRPPPLIKKSFTSGHQQQQSSSLTSRYKTTTPQRSQYTSTLSSTSSSLSNRNQSSSNRNDINNLKFSRSGKDKLELSMDVSGKRFTGVLSKKKWCYYIYFK